MVSLLGSELVERKVLIFQELRNFQCIFRPKNPDFNTFQNFFADGTASVPTHREECFTGSSAELSFALKTAVSNRTTKKVGALQLMSTAFTRIELELEDEGCERETEKGRE